MQRDLEQMDGWIIVGGNCGCTSRVVIVFGFGRYDSVRCGSRHQGGFLAVVGFGFIVLGHTRREVAVARSSRSSEMEMEKRERHIFIKHNVALRSKGIKKGCS